MEVAEGFRPWPRAICQMYGMFADYQQYTSAQDRCSRLCRPGEVPYLDPRCSARYLPWVSPSKDPLKGAGGYRGGRTPCWTNRWSRMHLLLGYLQPQHPRSSLRRQSRSCNVTFLVSYCRSHTIQARGDLGRSFLRHCNLKSARLMPAWLEVRQRYGVKQD